MEQLIKENESLKAELSELRTLRTEIIEGCQYDDDVSNNDLISWISQMADEYDPNKIDELTAEIESLKKSNAQKTKVIHRLRKEVKETHDELKVENNDLQEEFDRYKFDYFFAEDCSFCKIDLTYDDYQLSLGLGKWCCERCYEEKELEKTNPFSENCGLCKKVLAYDDYELSLDAGSWCCEECYEEALEERNTDADKLRESFSKDLDEKNEYIRKILVKARENEKKYEKKIFVLEQTLKGK